MTHSSQPIPAIPRWKRAMDVVLCSFALICLWPVFLVVAALVKLGSPGPVFFIGRRAGLGGREFGMYKFRTMHVGSERLSPYTGRGDTRVFAIGRFLRLFKLDELPQLVNILKGEMSIVGPRPEEMRFVRECYTPEQMRVLDTPPGLVDIPAVRYFPDFCHIETEGMDPETHYRKVLLPWRLDLDLEYLEQRSFWLDSKLILTTIALILFKTWWIVLFGQPLRPLPERYRQSTPPERQA